VKDADESRHSVVYGGRVTVKLKDSTKRCENTTGCYEHGKKLTGIYESGE
jgi:hypothetical protein